MLSGVSHVCFLLTSCLVITIDGNVCEDGWFGEDCDFRCHCLSSIVCTEFGTCPYSDPCSRLYFGPACQYVNLLVLDGSPSNEQYLIDHNHTTCNPASTATSASVLLMNEYPLSWFRLHLNNASKLLDFTVKLDDVDGLCDNEERFQVSDTILDVTCHTNVSVTKLQLDGDIVPHICSLYISGGRNIALRQVTNQPHNSTNPLLSRYAIDGVTDSESNASCTQLDVQQASTEWQLVYSHDSILYFIHLYFRQFQAQPFPSFSLQTLDTNDNAVTNFTDEILHTEYMYLLPLSEQTPIYSLTIALANVSRGLDAVLEICEAETYGDMVCPLGNFGLICEGKCSCSETEVCSPVTGACIQGCHRGFYGRNCSLVCSDQCLDKICHLRSGRCILCILGYTGDNCTQECPAGTYGVNCALKCSKYCSSTCNKTDGHCLCVQGYVEPLCKECKVGLYGRNCNLSCPVNCKDHRCDKVTGRCLACSSRVTGPQCTECEEGRYGTDCVFNCSRHCLNICDSIYGHCVCPDHFQEPYCQDCDDGFYGEECTLQCPKLCKLKLCNKLTGYCLECNKPHRGLWCEVEITIPLWKFFMPLSLLVLVSCPLTICFFLCRTKSDHVEPEDKKKHFAHRQL